jgi:branched-chain amino acid transport system substrate-binding protein
MKPPAPIDLNDPLRLEHLAVGRTKSVAVQKENTMSAHFNRRLRNWRNRLAIFIALGALGPAAAFAQASGEPVTIGVSGPLTGQNAQYGAQWKKGFDLALEEVNAKGVKGRPLQYVFEDSQADPRQSVAIAQKFVSDPKIVVEVGDFSSTASMAASSIYQRGGLVQFGFTNSHPNFTKGGDFMWSNSVSQADEQPRLAKYAADLGFKHVAVLYLNTDWGRSSQAIFTESVKSMGVDVVASEGYQPDEKDFRSTLVRVRDAKPDAIILISYYADGALITRQTRSVGLTQPIVASGSVYSPKFIELAGDAGNGVFTESNFFPGDTRPEVQSFVTKFKAKYNEEPDDFNAVAYDTIILLAAVIDKYGLDRTAIRDGLAGIKDVPSVIYGKASFDVQTRRVAGARAVYLVVKNGQFVLWDGKKPSAS